MDKDGKKLWFRAKRYGYGWMPCTWQGWFVVFVYVLAVTTLAWNIKAASHTVSDTIIGFAAPYAALTFFLIVICIFKGEKARWRWGRGTDDK